MTISSYSQWSATAALNVDIGGIPLNGAVTVASDLDDISRELMAQLKTANFTSLPADPNADRLGFWDDSASAFAWLTTGAAFTFSTTNFYVTETFIIPIGDETTVITTGTAKRTFRMPFAFTLTAVRASLTTASSSGLPTFDINEGGNSILSTKLTIDANEKTSTTAATPAVLSDTALADDAEMTIDIDVAGTGAKGAKITLIGYRP